MNLDDPTLFALAARFGSLAAVAQARGTDPSTISRRLAALEASLGVRLFQSTTRSLSLTEAGDLYPSRALPLVAELTRLGHDARAARSTPTGLLRLTASVTFGQAMILPPLPAFRAVYPDLRLECLDPAAILDATLSGLGVAPLPNHLTDRLITQGRLSRLFPDREVTATSFDTGAWAVYPSRSFLPAKTRAMNDFLSAALPRTPAFV
jgi:DNA-binding transcriptional LysR family regulator